METPQPLIGTRADQSESNQDVIFLGKHKLPPDHIANDIYLTSSDARAVGRCLNELIHMFGIKQCDLVTYLYITKVGLYRILHGMIRSKKSYRFVQLGIISLVKSNNGIELNETNHNRYAKLNNGIEELLLKETQ